MRHVAKIDFSAMLRMSSLEIAELVGAEHRNVKRSIERLAESGAISLSPVEKVKIQRERRMETVSVYVFSGEKGRLDAITVVAQLSPIVTAAIVKRWDALEREVARLRREEKERIESRLRARLENPAMTAALKNSRELIGKETQHFHFSNENNLIYRVAFGQSCKEFKLARGLRDDDSMRDALSATEIALVDKLQQANTMLISMGMGFDERKERLSFLVTARIQQKEAA